MKKHLEALLYLPSSRNATGFRVQADTLQEYIERHGQTDGPRAAFEKLRDIVTKFGGRSPIPKELMSSMNGDRIDEALIELHRSPERFFRRLFLKCEGIMSHDFIRIADGKYWRIVGMNPHAYLVRSFVNGRWDFKTLGWESVENGYRLIDVRAVPQWLELQQMKKVS